MQAQDLARAREKCAAQRRLIVFIDESGLSERPTRLHTSAPNGCMPLVQCMPHAHRMRHQVLGLRADLGDRRFYLLRARNGAGRVDRNADRKSGRAHKIATVGFMLILALMCTLLMWFAHALGSWRVALLLYPLPALAAWHMGAPWLAPLLAVSAAGLFVRDARMR